MTTLYKQLLTGAALFAYSKGGHRLLHIPRTSEIEWPGIRYALTHLRLNTVLQNAPEVLFDDGSRLVLFSDCHRGDNSRADIFAVNESLFLHALQHYERSGFTYIEVGDGDELWENRRFAAIRQAHEQVYDTLHHFDQQGRLHLIYGNHDITGSYGHQVDKDGITAHEGLLLRHIHTGQRILLTHGHQADLKSDALYRVSRLAARNVWRRLQNWGLFNHTSRSNEGRPLRGYERFLIAWAERKRQMLICGHTHRSMMAVERNAAYFNTGSCVLPGVLTGFEIQDGEIRLVHWSARPGSAGPCRRDVLGPPQKLVYFANN